MAEKKNEPLYTSSQVAEMLEAGIKAGVVEALKAISSVPSSSAHPNETSAQFQKRTIEEMNTRHAPSHSRVPCRTENGVEFTALVDHRGIFTAPEFGSWKYPDGATKTESMGGHVPDGRQIFHGGNGTLLKDHQLWMTQTYSLPVLSRCGQPADRALRDWRLDSPSHPANAPTNVTTVSPAAAVERA